MNTITFASRALRVPFQPAHAAHRSASRQPWILRGALLRHADGRSPSRIKRAWNRRKDPAIDGLQRSATSAEKISGLGSRALLPSDYSA
ncbi:hypothetical protein PSPO01_14665 [Paraphaeosphaeria sporulosa]